MRSVKRARAAAALAAASLAVATLIASGSPAAAYWQYTRWGMSPAQVLAASEGTAVSNANRGLDADDLKAELVAPYKGAQVQYTAVFLFDATDQLQYVTLNPVDQNSCPVIMQTLTANYGAPQTTDNSDYSTTVRWQDLGNNNTVIYFDLGQGNCSIQYSKLPRVRNDGTF